VVITFFGALVRATALGIVGWYVGAVYLTYVDAISKIEKYIFAVLILAAIFFAGRFLFKKHYAREKNQNNHYE
jgi:membrane protein DedA with SNARE-associated domain